MRGFQLCLWMDKHEKCNRKINYCNVFSEAHSDFETVDAWSLGLNYLKSVYFKAHALYKYNIYSSETYHQVNKIKVYRPKFSFIIKMYANMSRGLKLIPDKYNFYWILA